MIDKPRLREFLLGGLAPEEAEALEERMFADDALYQEFEEEREALVEEYAAESLTGEDRVRFERQISLSPELAGQVGGLRDLKELLERRRKKPNAGIAETGSYWRSLSVAMGVCLLGLMLLSCVQWQQNRRLQAESAQRADGPRSGVRAVPVETDRREGVVFLAAGVVRGPQDVPRVEIQPGASLVQLQIEVPESEARAKSWAVEVSRDGQEIFRCDAVFARSAGTIRYLPVYIAAESLPEGSYSVRIRSTDPGQGDQSRAFTIGHALRSGTEPHGTH